MSAGRTPTPGESPGEGRGADRADTADGARGRHPTARRWRPDHHRLADRLAAHLEARGWPTPEAHAAARSARERARPR
ncbi:MAG: hypothetical protein KDB10_09895 [Acidimicrobiales bacterium]|nr:hypothetical protein [Acidimicrobiales bacterium]